MGGVCSCKLLFPRFRYASPERFFMEMKFAGRALDMSRCHVMGVLNVTPDSVGDGDRFNQRDEALVNVRRQVADGAALIDVGREPKRPGAALVSGQEDLDRVCAVVETISRELDVVVSVDAS